MIKGIFFDAAGVLYKRSAPTADFALELLKNENFSKTVTEEESENLAKMRVEATQGVGGHESYWHHFLMFHGVQSQEQRAGMIKKIVEFSNSVDPVAGCRETLSELKKRGYILGIISDTIYPLEWKMTRLAKAGVADMIEIVACSTDLGMHKPDPAFYRYAVNQADLTPAETAFVGHDLKELRGARRAGMLTVAVNYDPGAKADYYCQQIIEMLDIPVLASISVPAER
jgi:HAD superfamily hydrolase (TIGR01509 family)